MYFKNISINSCFIIFKLRMQVEFCQIVGYINRFPNIEPTLLFLDKSIGHGILFSWYDININHIIIIVFTNILFWIFPLIFKHILLFLVILNSFSRLLMIFSLTIYSIEYEGCLCFLKVERIPLWNGYDMVLW